MKFILQVIDLEFVWCTTSRTLLCCAHIPQLVHHAVCSDNQLVYGLLPLTACGKRAKISVYSQRLCGKLHYCLFT